MGSVAGHIAQVCGVVGADGAQFGVVAGILEPRECQMNDVFSSQNPSVPAGSAPPLGVRPARSEDLTRSPWLGSRLARLVVSAGLAFAIVAALFGLMQVLIGGVEGATVEQVERPVIVLQTERRDEAVQRNEAPQPPAALTPPPAVERVETRGVVDAPGPIAPMAGNRRLASQDIDIRPVSPPSVEQPILRQVRYPEAALRRDLAGQCAVTVDVTPDGAVVNPRAACSHAVFVRSVERDALNWRYRPAVGDDGDAVMRRNLLVTVAFVLPD